MDFLIATIVLAILIACITWLLVVSLNSFFETYFRSKNKKEFLNLLEQGVRSDTLVKEWKELEQLFKIVYRTPLSNKNSKTMTHNLGEFLKLIIANKLGLDATKNKEWKNAITEFLEES